MSTAAPPFDPYREWLGIEPREQPADFYRLLGVARFETDLARIATAADQRMALVRSFQTGPRGTYTQRLLNELSAARVALLSPASKALYDQALAQHLAARIAPTAANAPAYAAPAVLTFGVGQTAPAAPPVLPPAPPPTRAPRLSLQVDSRADDQPLEVPQPKAWWRPLIAMVGVPLLVLAAVVAWGVGKPYFLSDGESESDQLAASASGDDEAASPTPVKPEPPKKKIVLLQEGSGEVAFSPATATLSGTVELQVNGTEELLTNWTTAEDAAEWHFKLVKPGFFEAEIVYATIPEAGGAALELVIGERTTTINLRPSGGLDQFINDSKQLVVQTNGEHTLIVRPKAQPAGNWLVLRSVRFIPPQRPEQPAEPTEQP
jgi:hypothetical protein